ncbi:MAG: hypothetical protein IKK57_02020 [Clostridia bacterium]|nr:hypothetical protein [Clostridia bacterium]
MNLDRCLLFSWIEEDNIQKAYFRVRPLLTSEGDVRAEAAELWPGEGCLRIVPDRNELHSFKGRMRSLGSWCVVDLRGLPADAGKIRTNKNFNPAKGEVNQYILYSDTVKELPDNSFYQIVDGTAADVAAACAQAITPRFYLREGDTLYGPVCKDAPGVPQPAEEAAGTLFEIPCPDGATRLILCLQDAPAPVLRQPVQRVNPAPARPAAAPDAAPAAPEAKADAPASAEDASASEQAPVADDAPSAQPPEQDAPAAETPVNEDADSQEAAVTPAKAEEAPATAEEAGQVPAVTPAPKAAEAADEPEALPIGQKLNILDASKGHDETIQALDKPVSTGANLLHARESRPVQPQPLSQGKTAPQGGTRLMPTPLRTSTPQPKNRLQELATGHFIGSHGAYEPPTGALPKHTRLQDVDNPVEAACASLRHAWHQTEAHTQLIDCILSLDGFRTKLENRLCQSSGTTLLQKVLRDRLQDLEAERLSALCELDRARRDTDAYKAELTAALRSRLEKETRELQSTCTAASARVEALRSEVNALQAQRDALTARVEQLQQDTLPAEVSRLLTDAQMLSPTMGTPLRMAPVAGQAADLEELVSRLNAVFTAAGLQASRNQMIALLVLLALSPRIGLVSPTVAPMATLCRNIAAAFGWTPGVAHQYSQEQRPLVAARPEGSTPAVLMTSMQNYSPIAGVTKVLLNRNVPGMIRNAAYDADQWPVVVAPALPFVDELPADEAAPVSAASLAALLDTHAADDKAIRTALEPVLRAAPPLSGAARRQLFRFVSVCAGLMDGGFASAADWAILLWVLPSVDRAGRHYAAVKAALDEYPMSQAAL